MKHFNKIIRRIMNHKLNNHGSTLLTVIICIAFISILGSLMLSVTMTNLQMKMIESKSKTNFYSCEAVMEKIKSAAQEIASQSVQTVYVKDILVNYATYLTDPEVTRNEKIQKKVMAQFINSVCGIELGVGYDAIDNQTSTTYYSITPDYFDNYLETGETGMVTWPEENACEIDLPSTIRLKDITIQYDNNGYRTAITSDIVITLPEFSFSDGTQKVVYKMTQPYQQYVLVADGAITSDNVDGTTAITGNVYTGSDINVNGQSSGTFSGNHHVDINGGTIITKGDITVGDTATLDIGATSKPVIWTQNLITYTSQVYSSSGSSLPTTLKINGISVIRDDLTLDGKNSNVIINKKNNDMFDINGAYIGYTGTHDSSGSSIIMNGAGSSLDLSGLEDLILAGRAHVSVQDLALNKDVNIMTGESLAFKSNQRAYLLPAKFIMDILHNPVTEEDYTDLVEGTPVVTIDDTSEAIKYNDYVAATPYKIAAKQTGDTILRYYFLNFLNGKMADAYFKEFYNLYSGVLNNIAPLSLGAVTLPSSGTVSVAGNLMSYNKATGVISLTPGMSDGATYIDDAQLDAKIADITLDNTSIYNNTVLLGQTVSSLGDMYSELCTDNTVVSRIKSGGVAYIVNGGLTLSSGDFTYNCSSGDATFSIMDSSEQFWIIDGNVTIAPYNPIVPQIFNGIIIATGDITICDGAQMNGLLISTGEKGTGRITVGSNVDLKGRIITTGEIALGQDCSLEINTDTEDTLNNIFATESSILGNVFKNAEMTVDYTIDVPASNMVDLTNMVSYENWRKIE